MKKPVLFFIALLAFLSPVFSQQADDIAGTWLSQDKDARILVYRTGGKYSGKIIWLKEPYEADGKTIKRDTKNDKAALRSRAILGMVILTGFRFDGDEWDDGEIYDPKSGNTYSSTMKLEDGKLKIRGYVGISAFGRTTEWTRIKSE